MERRRITIRFDEDVEAWRIYWSTVDVPTLTLADPRVFGTLEEAGPVARALMTTDASGNQLARPFRQRRVGLYTQTV